MRMGYTIRIGEQEVDTYDTEDAGESFSFVRRILHPDAPTFEGDVTGQGNDRSPSYTGWSDFAREVGLFAFFFDEECGLMRHHPGCFHVKPKHLEEVRDAYARWRKGRLHQQMGWDEAGTLDHNGARLAWLVWWLEWALANCKQPAFYNS